MSRFKAPEPTAVGFVEHGKHTEFFVHRVYCVGRNYADHAKEMGSDGREPPFFFCKPADAVVYVPEGSSVDLPFPQMTSNLHHEVELVVALGEGGRNLTRAEAGKCIAGYAVGFDMTRRDLQGAAKAAGKPWETGKAFDQSAPMGPVYAAEEVMKTGRIQLWKNGELRQDGDISTLIWAVDETIAELSRYFELKAGDLIFTGTPAGVGAVEVGDSLRGSISHLGSLEVRYT